LGHGEVDLSTRYSSPTRNGPGTQNSLGTVPGTVTLSPKFDWGGILL